MTSRKSLFAVVTSVAIAMLISACSGAEEPSAPAAEVSVQMSWLHEYSSAELYAAEQNGHFASENLIVNLIAGGFVDGVYIESIDEVVNGTVDFGASSANALLLARAEGKPVVAIASVLQRSPFALISLAENNIIRPQDLLGKTVAVNDGGARQIYNALLTTQSIDLATVNTISRTSFGIDALVVGEVDVMGGWITNEGVALQEAGFTPNYILLSDYGIDTYDKVFFTTEEMIENNPDVVRRFVRAIVKGLQDVVDDPEASVRFTLQYNDSLIFEEQHERLLASIPLLHPAGTSVGEMQADVWEFTHQVMLDEGALSTPLTVSDVYSMEFIQGTSD